MFMYDYLKYLEYFVQSSTFVTFFTMGESVILRGLAIYSFQVLGQKCDQKYIIITFTNV